MRGTTAGPSPWIRSSPCPISDGKAHRHPPVPTGMSMRIGSQRLIRAVPSSAYLCCVGCIETVQGSCAWSEAKVALCWLTLAPVLPKMTSAAIWSSGRRGKPTGSCVRKSTDGVTGVATRARAPPPCSRSAILPTSAALSPRCPRWARGCRGGLPAGARGLCGLAPGNPLDRAAVLGRRRGLIRSRPGGAVTLVRENGKTLAEARVEVAKTADFLDFYASFARQPLGRDPRRRARRDADHRALRAHRGGAGDTPWNDPLLTPARKLGPGPHRRERGRAQARPPDTADRAVAGRPARVRRPARRGARPGNRPRSGHLRSPALPPRPGRADLHGLHGDRRLPARGAVRRNVRCRPRPAARTRRSCWPTPTWTWPPTRWPRPRSGRRASGAPRRAA